MKFRTKVYFSLIGITLLGTILSVGILYTETRKDLFNELRNKAVTIASTTAAILDGDLVKKMDVKASETSPEYLQLVQILRKIRDANRSGSTYVKYIYTILPDPQDNDRLIFGVDADEVPSHFGESDLADMEVGMLNHLKEPYSPPEFIDDQYGSWESGFAPIFDSSGNYVATLGVDIPASLIISKLNRIFEYGAWAIAISLFIAFAAAHALAKRVSSSLAYLCQRAKEIGEGDLMTPTKLTTNDEFEVLADTLNQMTRGLEERERLKLNFARYVSQHILDKIIASPAPLKLEGERRKVTLLFSDIREFTRLSEKMAPELVVSYLNEYFGTMLSVIFKNNGTLDKFMGDGIMVEFGAPIHDSKQEFHAVTAALEMQEALQRLCKKWKKEGKPIIEIGIGIHTGQAVVGNIGTETRMDYTAIGDAVNVASRLERATKTYKTSILVSEETYLAVKDQFSAVHLGPIALPGRTEEIQVYAILPRSQP
jgi:adenylate cyclase